MRTEFLFCFERLQFCFSNIKERVPVTPNGMSHTLPSPVLEAAGRGQSLRFGSPCIHIATGILGLPYVVFFFIFLFFLRITQKLHLLSCPENLANSARLGRPSCTVTISQGGLSGGIGSPDHPYQALFDNTDLSPALVNVDQRSANLFYERPAGTYLRLCRPCGLCCNCSAVYLWHKNSRTQYTNK